MVAMRTLITGASGSGTTTLGRTLATMLKVPFFDADKYYWLPTEPPYRHKRTASVRLSMLTGDLDGARNGAVVAGSISACVVSSTSSGEGNGRKLHHDKTHDVCQDFTGSGVQLAFLVRTETAAIK